MAAARDAMRFLCPPSLRGAVVEIVPRFEAERGRRVAIDWQLMPPMQRFIAGGWRFDVAILTPELMQAEIGDGRIDAASARVIASTGIGVAVRKGAPRPDISTSEGLRRSLLAARSIAYTGDGAAGRAVLAIIARLGIGPTLASRLRPMPGGGAVEPVASGEVELAITTIPGILEVDEAEYVGPLPAELQWRIVYVAGLSATADDPQGGAELIDSFGSAAAGTVLRAKGIEPAN